MNSAFRAVTLTFLLAVTTLPVAAETGTAIVLGEIKLMQIRETELAQAVLGIKAVQRPVLGPRGERGRWTVYDELLSGYLFYTTFFIREGRVTRVEKLWTSSGLNCKEDRIGDRVLLGLQASYGIGQVFDLFDAQGTTQQSAAWAIDDIRLALHAENTESKCSTRIVIQPLQLKDAAEL